MMRRWQLQVLGPVAVLAGRGDTAGAVTFPSARQRALVAALVERVNEFVPTEHLVQAVWGDDPPRSAAANLRNHVASIRQLPFPDGAPFASRLLHRRGGYLLELADGELDSLEYADLVAAGRAAAEADRVQEAAQRFRAALNRWRGRPFEDVDCWPSLQAHVLRLLESRQVVTEELVDMRLAAGESGQLITELRAAVDADPLRERPWAQLILALYRSGRQAAALEAYAEVRRVLVTELAVEPGPELRELHRRILEADTSVEPVPVAATAPSAPTRMPTPHQLPAAIADFVSREAEVTTLRGLLADTAAGGARPVALVVGQGGVGKTALAVHVAHQVQDAFPDGQLYVNLRGAEARPADPRHVLAQLLRALGVTAGAMPGSLDERAALYRSRLADRKVLVLLDDAAGEAQVRPLLPGRTCAVVVTSRAMLPGLEGVRRIHLDVLGVRDATGLLARTVGDGRAAAEPAAAEELVRLCGGLPLAVRIAGARLASRPHWTLGHLVARLSDERGRLDELRVGDLEVRASAGLSYQGLDEPERRAFRLLGLLDAPTFGAWLAAAMLQLTIPAAEEVLDRLVERQVMDAVRDGRGGVRYRFHDLLRVYARERAEAAEPAAGRQAALSRALGAVLTVVRAANQRLSLSYPPLAGSAALAAPLPAADVERLVDDPLAWFVAERPALVAGVEQAAAAGLNELCWELACALADPLSACGYMDDWRSGHETAIVAARASGDQRGVGAVLLGLAECHSDLGEFLSALDCAQQAAAAFAAAGDRSGEARARGVAAMMYRITGELDVALRRCREAEAVCDGDEDVLAYLRCCAGSVRLEQGHLDEAVTACADALRVYLARGNHYGEMTCLRWLAAAYRLRGELAVATSYISRFRERGAARGDHRTEATGLLEMGEIRTAQGRFREAEDLLRQGLEVCRHTRLIRARTLRALGALEQGRGRWAAAARQYTEAAGLLAELRCDLDRARALRGLGEVYAATGDSARAREAWDTARDLFTALGLAEAGTVPGARGAELGRV
ncbi:MAG: AfsR/SARP family transcriptional regulator [Mycobacteriales bacterium]